MFVLAGSASLVLGLVGPITPAHAATISPTVFTDDNTVNGNCSLREAIIAANTNATVDGCVHPGTTTADTIQLAAGTPYTLSLTSTNEDAAANGDLDVTESLTLQRQGSTGTVTIDGNDVDRVFHVLGTPNVTFADMTITDGTTAGGSFSGGGIAFESSGALTLTNTTLTANEAQFGGGLSQSSGSLAMSGSTVSQNEVDDSGGGVSYLSGSPGTITSSTIGPGNTAPSNAGMAIAGGGLSISGSTIMDNISTVDAGGAGVTTSLTLTDSLVSGNIAASGGGIHNSLSSATTTVIRSTITDNRSESTSVGNGGGIRNVGTLTVRNSTISGNRAHNFGGGVHQSGSSSTSTFNNATITENVTDEADAGAGNGGGISLAGGAMSISNTILAGNIDRGGEAPDCNGTITSNGHNLLGDSTGCAFTPTTGDIVDEAPLLGALEDNGGPTPTHLPERDSPAIDAGNPATPLGTPPQCESNDQRDVARPEDGDDDTNSRCDIGSVERQGPKDLTVSATGPGTVTGSGISCPTGCTDTYEHGTVVELTADPDAGEVFDGWGGACVSAGTDPTCNVTMDQDRSVSASFSFAGRTLAVSKAGSGSGTVTSLPAGIECGSECIAGYSPGTVVSLNASPDDDSLFTGWSGGGCSGTGACQVTMSSSRNVTATFVAAPAAKGVTLAASKKKVDKGKKVTLTAGILPCTGHEGDVVDFMRGSKQIASVPTNQGCVASTKVRLRRRGTFTATSAAQGVGDVVATSPSVTVKVKKP